MTKIYVTYWERIDKATTQDRMHEIMYWQAFHPDFVKIVREESGTYAVWV